MSATLETPALALPAPPEAAPQTEQDEALNFPCVLDEQPSFLVPAHMLSRAADDDTTTLIVNPLCSFTWERAPARHAAACRELFAEWQPAGCVEDAATGMLMPFALGPACEGLLRRARRGKAAPGDWPLEAVRVFRKAGIVVAADGAASRIAGWRSTVAKLAPQFRNGYAPLAAMLHPFHLGALRMHYRRMIRKGRMYLGDDQSSLRYVEHNEPVARFFHRQLTRTISAIAGEPLKPSYVYSACYLGGAELESHRDRAQCEFSISFAVDFSPEPSGTTPWPLCLETRQGTVRIFQRLGDGLLYRGRRLAHFRTALQRNATSTSIFFHYVRKSFSGRLD